MSKYSYLMLSIAIATGIVLGCSLYRHPFACNYDTAQTALQKFDWLWSQIIADRKPGEWQNLIQIARFNVPSWLGGMDFKIIGTQLSDQIPNDVWKGIHGVGITAKGKFVWNDNVTKLGLTGNFKKGHADYVIARFSNALPKISMQYVPNMAFKILRNNVASGNLFGSHAIVTQKTGNWFENGMCNIVPTIYPGFSLQGFQNLFLTQLFKKAGHGQIPNILGNARAAEYDQNGHKEDNIVSPFALCYQPIQSLHTSFEKSDTDWDSNYIKLTELEPNTKLYEVYAIMNFENRINVTKEDVHHIGHFEITEKPTTSKFGDYTLFFAHTYWKTEVELQKHAHPEWARLTEDDFKHEGIDKYSPQFLQQHRLLKRIHKNKKKRMLKKN